MNSRASLAILSSRTPDDVVCKILFQYPAAGFFVSLPQYMHTAHSMWDLSFPTRDQTCAPCSGSVDP